MKTHPEATLSEAAAFAQEQYSKDLESMRGAPSTPPLCPKMPRMDTCRPISLCFIRTCEGTLVSMKAKKQPLV